PPNPRRERMTIDQVTLQVVNNYLVTTAREMGIAMRNTSYSPLFNEGLDFSCAIFDDGGEMIAQAEFCPAHLGAIIYVVEWTILEIGRENFQPGDVVFHNDPFRGGCHLPEHCVVKPVFCEGELKEEIKDYSERRMRAEIAEMPDGVYEFEDLVADNDGITDVPALLKVKVTIAGDEMTVDYTGSDLQRRGPINCTYGVTASATY